MTGGTELRLGPPMRDGAGPVRAGGGSPDRQGGNASKEFGALLSGMGAKTCNAAQPRPGHGRAESADDAINAGEPKRVILSARPGDAMAAEDAKTAVEVVTLGPVPDGESLAEHVARQIATSAAGRQTTGGAAETSGETRPEPHPDDGARTQRSRLTSLPALARMADDAGFSKGGASGAAASGPLSVVRRETHFGATLSASGAWLAGRAPSGAAADDDTRADPARETGANNRGDAPGAVRQGRADQVMFADRGAAQRFASAARMPEGIPVAAVRAGAEEARSGGGLQQPGGDAARGPSVEGFALASAGGAEPRSSAPTAGATAPAPSAAPQPAPAAPGLTKVLQIQLQPYELGTLDIKMRLSDGGLEIHIEASRRETLVLLKSDREALESVIRGTGQSLDAVSVSLSEKSAAPGHSSQDASQSFGSGARPDAQSGSAREQNGRFADGSPSRPQRGPAFEQVSDDRTQQDVDVRPRGGIYL